jgi:hypothetical protein
VKSPDPLIVSSRGRQHLRVRHDDPHLGPYTPRGAVIRSAMALATDVEGLRLYLVTTVGDRYSVRVSDDGSVVGLWRRGNRARLLPSRDPDVPCDLTRRSRSSTL